MLLDNENSGFSFGDGPGRKGKTQLRQRVDNSSSSLWPLSPKAGLGPNQIV